MQEPSIVPNHESGGSSDNEHSVTKPDANGAHALFNIARERLLDVNNWHQLAGSGTAVFRLMDEKGNPVERPARLGDHFQIDIPGPGNSTGKGNDWVQIEAIEENNTAEHAVIAIRVRPTSPPGSATGDVAHFFSDEASSTFCVSRRDNVVMAGVYGRNEKPNLGTESLIDKVRNAVVGLGAIAGLNKPQWKSLVKGLLQESSDR